MQIYLRDVWGRDEDKVIQLADRDCKQSPKVALIRCVGRISEMGLSNAFQSAAEKVRSRSRMKVQ